MIFGNLYNSFGTVIVEKYKKCNKNNPLTPFDKGE
jgi:hypothetical protein